MLEVRGIETHYGNIPALRGISIDVPAGSVVAILGANGAGKTTLLKTIAGVLRPRSGTVSFLGEEITGLPSHKLVRRGVALVPEGRAILSRMTVRENLEMGRSRDATRRRLRWKWIACWSGSPSSRNGRGSSAGRSPGASSRCWRSPAR